MDTKITYNNIRDVHIMTCINADVDVHAFLYFLSCVLARKGKLSTNKYNILQNETCQRVDKCQNVRR